MYSFKGNLTERDKILQMLARENRPIPKKEIVEKDITKNAYRCIGELKILGATREDEEGNIFLHSQIFRTAIMTDMAVRAIEARKKEENPEK